MTFLPACPSCGDLSGRDAFVCGSCGAQLLVERRPRRRGVMRAGEFQARAWERLNARLLAEDSGREPMAVEAGTRDAQEAVSRADGASSEPVSRPDALAPVRRVRPGRVVA